MDWPICTTRLLDQNFGMCITPEDVILPFFNGHGTNYYRPWKIFGEAVKDFGSTIDNAKDKFKITLDVQHFKPNEINVKVNDAEITIEGKHEERQDDHGFISRQFIRRYALPKDCSAESVTSTLSSDGVLMIMANKVKSKEMKTEQVIPIKMCGPSSRKEECKSNTTNNGTCEKNKDIKCMADKTEKRRTEDKKETKTNMEMDKKETKTNIEMDKKDTKITTETNTKETKKETDIDSKDKQIMMKEEHCRLLKPELLKDAVSTTEKLISESKKEADELLKLITTDKTAQANTSAAGELNKIEEALGQCKTAIAELKKEKVGESILAEESSSFKSSMMSETIASKESSSSSSSFTSMSSSIKASSETSSDVLTEIICAELREAAENL